MEINNQPPPKEMPEFNLGQYKKTASLGKGAFFEIYLYENREGQRVAVKAMPSFLDLSAEAYRERGLKSEAQTLLALKKAGRESRVAAFKGTATIDHKLALVTEALTDEWKPLRKIGGTDDLEESERFISSLTPEQKLKVAKEMVGLFQDLYFAKVLSTFEFKLEHFFIKISGNNVSLKAIDFGITDKDEEVETEYRKQQLATTIFDLFTNGKKAMVSLPSKLSPSEWLMRVAKMWTQMPSYGRDIFAPLVIETKHTEIQLDEMSTRLDERIRELLLSSKRTREVPLTQSPPIETRKTPVDEIAEIWEAKNKGIKIPEYIRQELASSQQLRDAFRKLISEPVDMLKLESPEWNKAWKEVWKSWRMQRWLTYDELAIDELADVAKCFFVLDQRLFTSNMLSLIEKIRPTKWGLDLADAVFKSPNKETIKQAVLNDPQVKYKVERCRQTYHMDDDKIFQWILEFGIDSLYLK